MGMLVVLEGIDGSGKGTQARLLVDALARRGFTARLFSFPCYDETFFGREVGRYLNGAFGDLHSVPPEFAALLYAGDRLEKRDELLVALRDADVVVCDRYVPSNFAHQAARTGEAIRKSGSICTKPPATTCRMRPRCSRGWPRGTAGP